MPGKPTPTLVKAVSVALVVIGMHSWWSERPAEAAAQDRLPAGIRADWPEYGGVGGERYSPLKQINRNSVRRLKVAWTFDTDEEGGLQTNPLVIGGACMALHRLKK